MKKKSKMLAVTAAIICSAVLFSGCNKNSPQNLAKSALDNLNKKTSATMDAAIDIAADISSAEIGSMNMTALQTSSISYMVEPEAVYTKGTYQQTLGDAGDITTDIETYLINEEGKKVTYSKAEDIWMRIDGGDSMKSMAEAILNAIAGKKGEASVDKELQALDGGQAYVIRAQVPASEIESIMSTAEGMLGHVASDKDANMPSVSVILYIYKDTKLPAQIVVDMKDCGTYMISSIEGASGEFSKYDITISYAGFDNVDTIEVPKEAKENAISGTLPDIDSPESSESGQSQETTGYNVKGHVNEDGAFEVNLDGGDNMAYVGLPEGYKEDTSSMYYLSLINDNNVRLDYTYADLYAADTIADEYKEMMSYMNDDDRYSNVTFGETQTFESNGNTISYICLTYDYTEGGSWAEYLTWTQDKGIVFTCQVTNLSGSDDALIHKIYDNIKFK